MMAKKKFKKKKLARLEAKALIRRWMALEPIPTKDGMVIPAISFDLDNISEAKDVLMAAGYSSEQANVIINNTINNVKRLVEEGFDKK